MARMGRTIPRWVKDGTFTEAWDDAPQRGDTVEVRVEFADALETGDGEEWSQALLRGRASQADEHEVTALMAAISKLCPKELEGHWDVRLVRDAEDQPWKLVS